MDWWREYILSVVCSVLIGGVVVNLVSDLRYGKLIRFVYGTCLAVSVLGPLSVADITDSVDFSLESESPELLIERGRQEALRMREECITEACETYISNKAKDLGAIVTADVYLDETLKPYFAEIYPQTDSEQYPGLEQILEDDLGITKENQAWIWNREKDSS